MRFSSETAFGRVLKLVGNSCGLLKICKTAKVFSKVSLCMVYQYITQHYCRVGRLLFDSHSNTQELIIQIQESVHRYCTRNVDSVKHQEI